MAFQNGGFETGDLTGWSTAGSGGAAHTEAVDETSKFSGIYGAHLSIADGASRAEIAQDIGPIQVGAPVLVMIKCPVADLGAGESAEIVVMVLDGGFEVLYYDSFYQGGPPPASMEWIPVYWEATFSADSTILYISIETFNT